MCIDRIRDVISTDLQRCREVKCALLSILHIRVCFVFSFLPSAFRKTETHATSVRRNGQEARVYKKHLSVDVLMHSQLVFLRVCVLEDASPMRARQPQQSAQSVQGAKNKQQQQQEKKKTGMGDAVIM